MSRVLILGVSGMLGSATFRLFSGDKNYEVFGTARSLAAEKYFSSECHNNIITGIDVLDSDSLLQVMERIRPDVVINCVGLIKQLSSANDPLVVLPINSLFPHRLARICKLVRARLIHISTDCVFDGAKGRYAETDVSNATDLYGKSKYIGEVHNELNAITLRTSIIGHELNSQNALIEWFLAQTKPVNGFKKAIFSGLPTVELARVIKDYVVPRPSLSGLYHISADAISKFDLLSLVSKLYDKKIDIIPESNFIIDRTLDSTRFRLDAGYEVPSWVELVTTMKNFK